MVEQVTRSTFQIHDTIAKLNESYVTLWKEDMFLTWRWWLNVALLVLPWCIWFLLRKKDSTNRLILSGLFVYLITSSLDSIGVAFGLWHYLYTPFPYIHTFFLPWDFGSFPVMVMLLVQYKPQINPYIKAVFFAIISAFIFEPLFIWLKVYVPIKWHLYYGVPIYFLIYIIAHRVSRRSNFEPIS